MIGSSNVVAVGVLFGVLILLGWRMLITAAYRHYEVPNNLIILGAGDLALDLVQAIETRADLNMKVVGLVGSEPGEELNPQLAARGLRILGTTDTLEALVQEHGVNRVAVALSNRRGKLPVRVLLNLKLRGVEIDDAWSLYEKITGKIRTTELPPGWLVFGEGFKQLSRKVRHKEVVDFVLALISGVVAVPLSIMVAIIVKLDSKGPILFRQERVGYKGQPFNIIKFRTMRVDAEALSGPKWATEDDPRITRAGRFLRKTRPRRDPANLETSCAAT